jgi:hypothetical protein
MSAHHPALMIVPGVGARDALPLGRRSGRLWIDASLTPDGNGPPRIRHVMLAGRPRIARLREGISSSCSPSASSWLITPDRADWSGSGPGEERVVTAAGHGQGRECTQARGAQPRRRRHWRARAPPALTLLLQTLTPYARQTAASRAHSPSPSCRRAALPADQPPGPGNRGRAVRVAEHDPHAHTRRLRQARVHSRADAVPAREFGLRSPTGLRR